MLAAVTHETGRSFECETLIAGETGRRAGSDPESRRNPSIARRAMKRLSIARASSGVHADRTRPGRRDRGAGSSLTVVSTLSQVGRATGDLAELRLQAYLRADCGAGRGPPGSLTAILRDADLFHTRVLLVRRRDAPFAAQGVGWTSIETRSSCSTPDSNPSGPSTTTARAGNTRRSTAMDEDRLRHGAVATAGSRPGRHPRGRRRRDADGRGGGRL